MSLANHEAVQLDGAELEEMRTLKRSVEQGLRSLSERIRAKTPGSNQGERITSAHYFFDNDRIVVWDGGKKCYVLEDPPGICRGCQAGRYGEG